MSSCSLKWYSPASSPGHWWPVRVALPREPPSPASYLYSRRTWLPKTAHWKWGRIYRRTILSCLVCGIADIGPWISWQNQRPASFLWLPNFRKSHHLSTWKMSGVRCWYCPWHDFWYLGGRGFQGKQSFSGHPLWGFSRFFSRKIGSWGFPQIRFFFPPCHLFFLKKASLAGIFFLQLINCGEVQVPKKTAWNIFRVWMGQWLIYVPKSWRLAWPMLTINYLLFLHINTKDVVPLPSDEYKLCLNGWIWRCHSRELGKNWHVLFSINSIAASAHVWTCHGALAFGWVQTVLTVNCWIWRCHSRELGKNCYFPDMFCFQSIASRLLRMSEPAMVPLPSDEYKLCLL